MVKFTIPSPNQFFHPAILNGQYKDFDEFAPDIIEAYRETLKEFYRIGVRYIQLDDVYLPLLLQLILLLMKRNIEQSWPLEL